MVKTDRFKKLFFNTSRSWMFLVAFFLDLLSFSLSYQRFIFPALINFCIICWFDKNYFIKILAAFSLIILASVYGQSPVLEAFFVFFTFLSLIFFKNLLTESFTVIFFVTIIFLFIYTIFAGTFVLWTFNGLIANMIVTYIMLKILM